jgi:HPt (histidine-containing phosphotransfer) domain-containing protein
MIFYGAVPESSYLGKRPGANEETFKEIVELFAIESAKLMKRIKDAITNEGVSELRSAAQTLKSSVRIFGVERAVAAALRLETVGHGENLVDAEEAWQVVASLLTKLAGSFSLNILK